MTSTSKSSEVIPSSPSSAETFSNPEATTISSARVPAPDV